MKTTIKTSLILLVMATAFSVTSCKSKKKQEVAVPTGEVLVNEYCTGPEFFSDKKDMFAVGVYAKNIKDPIERIEWNEFFNHRWFLIDEMFNIEKNNIEHENNFILLVIHQVHI